jgi:hypothetical protein
MLVVAVAAHSSAFAAVAAPPSEFAAEVKRPFTFAEVEVQMSPSHPFVAVDL